MYRLAVLYNIAMANACMKLNVFGISKIVNKNEAAKFSNFGHN